MKKKCLSIAMIFAMMCSMIVSVPMLAYAVETPDPDPDPDTTAPTISNASTVRLSESEATVKFTSSESGEYFYTVVEDGADEPAINTDEAGTACDTAEQVINLTTLTAGAKDIYILVKDAAGNISDTLMLDIKPLSFTFDISEGNITIADGTNAGTYKVIYGVPQIEQDNIPQSQTITLLGTTTTNRIDVTATEGTVKIYFNGLNTTNGMGLSPSENRDVEILLADDSDNLIRNSLSNASADTGGGLVITCENADQPGHICDEHCGSLDVYGPGGNGAGISGHNITINGGNIYAKGGNSSSGIGKYGFYGTVKNLRFNGGNITSDGTGSYGAAGIGGGDCTNADGIYIDGGIIKAKGGGSGPGIGGGQMFYGSGGQAHNIIINSGTVVATGNYGIGGAGSCSNIQINGGSVNASSIKIPPVNASAVEVYQTIITLDGINTETRVTDIDITGADYYNISDIFTDTAGKIYLYLPEDASVTSVTAGGDTYTGSIVTTSDGLANAVFELLDIVAPDITLGEVNRISDTEATVKFTSDESGEYYYSVVEDGADEPDINTDEAGTACDTAEQTISLDSLTAGAKDIYIAVKDAAGNVSEQVKINIDAYIPPDPGTIQFAASGYGTYEGYNGWEYVQRLGGSDGIVTVDYATVDDTAIAGVHYVAKSGTLTWNDGDTANKAFPVTIFNDSTYNGYLNFSYVLSNPTGGAVIGEQNPLNVQLSDNDVPPVPAGLKAKAGNKKVDLSWDPVNSAYYKLYYATVDGEFTEDNSISVYDGETYTMTELKNGTTYYFAVKAGHNIYFSDLSDTVSATPKASGGGGGGNYTPPVKEEPAEEPQEEITEPTYKPVNFEDVPQGAWFKPAVDFISGRGIAAGIGDNKFGPDMELTRGQFVVLLMNAFEISPLLTADDQLTDNFADAGDTYYTDYLLKARSLGIASGVGEDLFAPDKAVTRQEMSLMLYNALKVIDKLPGAAVDKEIDSFLDSDQIAEWAYEAMESLVKAGILSGSYDLLNPAATTSRAQMAQVLYSLLTQ